uniref:HTH_48 domain-containing protein n=1 Tax=Panagrellus redivivus TaxID=6233 RepID=A0A7E4V8K1_PANRE
MARKRFDHVFAHWTAMRKNQTRSRERSRKASVDDAFRVVHTWKWFVNKRQPMNRYVTQKVFLIVDGSGQLVKL